MTLPVPLPSILKIAPYVGGASSLSGVERVCKLSSNEGALGCSPRAQEAYRAAAASLHRYPDGGSHDLRQAISQRHGVPVDNIVCGAGSDELIGLLVKAYAGIGDEVLYPEHGFLMYGIYAHGAGAVPVKAAERQMVTDVDALLAAVTDRTRLVFVANPNNPTGTFLCRDELYRLRAGLPEQVLLVIDGAYAEFVDHEDYTDGQELALTTPNTVMLRTFSKLHGLGGCRVGWGVFPPAIADIMNRLRAPFNVSGPGLAAATAAMQDTDFQAQAKAHNDTWRDWLQQGIRALGLTTTDSVANFVLIHFPLAAAGDEPGSEAGRANAFLQSRGLIVRRVNGYGLADWLRITVGTEEENRLVLAALTDFCA